MFKIEFEENVEEELARIRPFDARRILDEISRQLKHEPLTGAKHRKILKGVRPPWTTVRPVWELRIGDYRIFYDVNGEEKEVIVRAVRHKPPHKTTEEIL